MDKKTEFYSEDMTAEATVENSPDEALTEDIAECTDDELEFEHDEEAEKQLREFEHSLNSSFKRTVIFCSVLLGIAIALGVFFTIVM